MAVNTVIAMRDIPMSLKNDEEIQKAILDFHKNGDSWG